MSYFTRKGAERVKAAVEHVERSYRGAAPGREPGSRSQAYAIHIKTGGGGIGAASSVTQMTSGTVAIWEADDTGALTDTGETMSVWNKSTTSIGANKHGLAVLAAGGYVVDWVEC